MRAQVGNPHRGAGGQDALHDRVIGRIEVRTSLDRHRAQPVAVVDRPHGEARRLFEQHDAGAIERHQLPQPVEERHQDDLAVETAGELDGRLAQLLGHGPGAALGLMGEPAVGDVARDRQNGDRRAPRPELRNEAAVELPDPVAARISELQPLGPSRLEDSQQRCVPTLD